MGRAGDVSLRVRRLLTAPQLQHLPLDAADMFILSRLEQPVAIADPADLATVALETTMRRVRALAERGAVELFPPRFFLRATALTGVDPALLGMTLALRSGTKDVLLTLLDRRSPLGTGCRRGVSPRTSADRRRLAGHLP